MRSTGSACCHGATCVARCCYLCYLLQCASAFVVMGAIAWYVYHVLAGTPLGGEV